MDQPNGRAIFISRRRSVSRSAGLSGASISSSISGVTAMNDGPTPKTVKVSTDSGVEFDAVVRIDTPGEANYFRNGGILQYVLRNMRSA